MKPRTRNTPVAAGWRLLPVAALLFAAPGIAETAVTESQREAAAILQRMTEYLAGLQAFAVDFRDGYDVVQASGQKVEFGETRSVMLARPNRLRVEEIASDGRRDLAVFDGRTVSVFNADAGVFAQAPQPVSLDDALVYFVRDLKMRMPLAIFLTTRLPKELPGRVTTVDYVESTDIWGAPAHHIAGRTENVDFQIWIRDGDQPLPLRVVISYVHAEGQPQFWATFANWNTNPSLTTATFEFAPPKDARRIAFAVQARQAAPAANSEVVP